MAPPSIETACPEKQLLVCCARTRMDERIAGRIRALLAGPLNWDYLLREAAEHSLTPLLARNLSCAAPSVAPPEPMKRLAEATRANAARALLMTAELIKIADLFQAAGIPAIPYKGPVIAVQAYGDITVREFVDLDIFVRQRDMAKANEIATGLGYAPKFLWALSDSRTSSLVPCEYAFTNKARGVMVELHTEETSRYFPVPPDIDDLWRRTVQVALSGHQVRTFAPEDGLPILCIHGSKDMWERISWIADVAELLRAHPQFDWEAALLLAQSLRAERMLHLGLELAAGLLEAPLPQEIQARVREDRVATQMASEVMARLLSRQESVPGAVGRFGFRRRMVQGAFAGWRYSIRQAVVPAEEDWMMVRLPRALAPLYVALRPLRLLRKYGGTGGSAERPST